MERDKIFFYTFTVTSFFLTLSCSKTLIPERFHYLDYEGKVNQHRKMIKAKPDIIFNMITDIEIFKTLYPIGFMEVTQSPPNPCNMGTLRHNRIKYLVELNWDSKVIEIVDNEKIVLRFLNGIFKGGYEIWELEEKGGDTEVSHTILYTVNGFFYSMVWFIKKGEKKHDYLVEETLNSIKRKAEVYTVNSVNGIH